MFTYVKDQYMNLGGVGKSGLEVAQFACTIEGDKFCKNSGTLTIL